MILEVCVDSVESAVAAQKGGAQRVELCADLAHGGTTPSAGMIQSVRKSISISLHTMIRPRPGDFCYSDSELDVMLRDIDAAKKLGSDGIVFGVLTSAREVDVERTRTLLEAARPMSVTFHRAIDDTTDALRAFEALANLGVDRVLTSGGKSSIAEGIAVVREMVQASQGALKIIAGGGISMKNVVEITSASGVREVHALTALLHDSQRPSTSRLFSASRYEIDEEKVRQMVLLLKQQLP